MNQPKNAIPIRPIDFDIARRAVDEFAAERNVPTQVFPHEGLKSVTAGTKSLDVSTPDSSEPPIQAAKPAPQQGKGRGASDARDLSPSIERAPVRKFTVELPEYVIDAIMARAIQVKPRKTSRYVILEALRAIGFEIKDVDMVVDGRRTPGSL